MAEPNYKLNAMSGWAVTETSTSLRRRLYVVTTILSIWLSATHVGMAQSVVPPASEASQSSTSTDNMVAGIADGAALAKRVRTGGKRVMGVPAGFFIYGVPLVFAIGPEPLSAEVRQQAMGKSLEYQLGLLKGWKDTTKNRKRNAFMQGWGIGLGLLFGMTYAVAANL
jgi:hypothetical protein